MQYEELIRKRRSVRRYDDRDVPREVLQRILERVADCAPSARNARSTRFLVVTDRETIGRIAGMRDYGSAFVAEARAVVVVAGDRTLCDLWRENCAISATMLLLGLVDEGLAGCWVHVDGRPRRKDAPDGEQAADYLRSLLPLPEQWGVLCAVACGYSDYVPKPLPERDRSDEIRFMR